MLKSSNRTARKAPAPRRVLAVRDLSAVRMIAPPRFAANRKRLNAYTEKGLRYQEQVTQKLEKEPNWEPVAGPWLEYVAKRDHRYGQPDWLGFNWEKGVICIAEMKLTRVRDAWWQLNVLYKPLISKLFPSFDIALLEIASRMKPVDVPEDVKVVWSVDDVEPGKTCFMRVPYE